MSETVIYNRLRVAPMSTTFMAERDVVAWIAGIGGRVLSIQRYQGRPGSDETEPGTGAGRSGDNRLYFVTRAG